MGSRGEGRTQRSPLMWVLFGVWPEAPAPHPAPHPALPLSGHTQGSNKAKEAEASSARASRQVLGEGRASRTHATRGLRPLAKRKQGLRARTRGRRLRSQDPRSRPRVDSCWPPRAPLPIAVGPEALGRSASGCGCPLGETPSPSTWHSGLAAWRGWLALCPQAQAVQSEIFSPLTDALFM